MNIFERVPLRRPWLAVAVLCLLTTVSGTPPQAQTVGSGNALPHLGDGQVMSLAAERRLGDRIARDLYRDPDYLDDVVVGDYVQAVWAPLLKAAVDTGEVPLELREQLAWELLVSRDRRVNAFALPGGYLGVHLGLIAATQSPDELASVLAHELSHVSQRHIARMVTRQNQQAPWVLGAMILAALAANASKNTDVVSAAVVGGQAVAAQTQLNFSRDMEREADRVGLSVMRDAGFAPAGFVGMFERLQQASRLNDDGAFPYLRSHPLTTERMADMRARIGLDSAGLSTTPPVSALWHRLMAERARVLAERNPDVWQGWLQHGSRAQAPVQERYAAALAAWRLGHIAVAQALAAQLAQDTTLTSDPAGKAVLAALHMELWMAQPTQLRRASADVMAVRDAAVRSESRALRLLGAEVALHTGGAAMAETALRSWVLDHPRDALGWQLLSRVHDAQGHPLRARRAQAEARVAHGDVPAALEILRAAQALPKEVQQQDALEQAVIHSRLRDLTARWQTQIKEDAEAGS
jgi:predicted Zn-dependent protease